MNARQMTVLEVCKDLYADEGGPDVAAMMYEHLSKDEKIRFLIKHCELTASCIRDTDVPEEIDKLVDELNQVLQMITDIMDRGY